MRWTKSTCIMSGITTFLLYPEISLALPSASKSTTSLIYERDVKAGDKFCGLSFHTSTISDNTLFLVGGQAEFQSPGSDGYEDAPSRQIVKIDLSKSWDAKSPSILGNLTIPSSQPPRGCNAALWQDGKTLYLYGGERPGIGSLANAPLPGNQVYEYDIAGDKWSSRKAKNLPIRGCGSFVQNNENQGFYLGGIKSPNNDPTMNASTTGGHAQKGLVALPLGGGPASIIPTTSLNTYGTMAGGTMVFVEGLGKRGSLVAFGGLSPSPDDDFNWGSETSAFNDMNQISIYDIDGGKWHRQLATGNVRARIQFCSIIQKAPDNSQTFIYIYGGYNHEYNIDQVDILSIPAFIWSTAAPPGLRARFQHTCNAYKSQMILVGGYVIPVNEDGSRNKDRDKRVCEPLNMYRVFDTSTHKWTDKFDPDGGDYKVAPSLVKLVGGSSSGGATVQQPAGGFTDPELEALFKSSTTSSGGDSNSGSSNGGRKKKDDNKGPSGAVIAGGVVGGVAVLAGIGGLIWFFVRRRKKGSKEDIPQPPAYKNEVFGNGNSNPEGSDRAQELASNNEAGSFYKPKHGASPAGQEQNVAELQAQSRPVELESPAAPVELPTEANQVRQPLLT